MIRDLYGADVFNNGERKRLNQLINPIMLNK